MPETPQPRKPDIEALSKHLQHIHECLLRFCLDRQHMRGVTAPHDARLFALRDSVMLRAQSVHWHVIFLFSYHTRIEAHANIDLATALELHQDPIFLLNARQQLTFLFDDLAFNVASLFDYLGQLMAHAFHEKSGRDHGWTHLLAAQATLGLAHPSLSKQARRGKTGPPLAYPEPLIEAVATEDREWLRDFRKFRHGIIHEEAQKGAAAHGLDFDTFQASVRVELPQVAQEALRSHVAAQDLKDLDLLAGAELIGRLALKSTAGGSRTRRSRTSSPGLSVGGSEDLYSKKIVA
jgi:hypothetical protein